MIGHGSDPRLYGRRAGIQDWLDEVPVDENWRGVEEWASGVRDDSLDGSV